MDLNKPITFGGKSKDGAKSKSKGKETPLKTYMNFAQIGEKPKTNWGLAVPGVLLIAGLAYLFSRYGVMERYSRLSELRAQEAELQRQLDDGYAQLAAMDEFSAEYYHYTWSGMTSSEINRVSRVSVAELLRYIDSRGVTIHSASLSDAKLSLSVTAGSLEGISGLIRELDGQEIVSSASVSTARSNAEGGEEVTITAGSTDVTAQLTIYLKTVSEIAADAAKREQGGS